MKAKAKKEKAQKSAVEKAMADLDANSKDDSVPQFTQTMQQQYKDTDSKTTESTQSQSKPSANDDEEKKAAVPSQPSPNTKKGKTASSAYYHFSSTDPETAKKFAPKKLDPR